MARIRIARPLEAVWEVFTTPYTWKEWWGGDLEGVEPAWEAGATLVWAMGSESRIVDFADRRRVVVLGNHGERYAWHFITEGPDETSVIMDLDLGSSSLVAADDEALRAEHLEALARLKACVEGATGCATEEAGSAAGALEEAQRRLPPRVAILEKGEPPREQVVRSFGFWFSAKKRALFEAIASGDAEAVREALARGAKPNSRLKGEPAVLKAAYLGRVDILKMLIAAGADVDRPVTGKAMGFGGPERTALVVAAFEGHVECVRALLKAGARVDASMLYQNKVSMCPVSAAAFNGHLEIVRLLLRRRANAAGHPWDRPLCYAVRGGTPDVVRLLLQAGADPNAAMDVRIGDSVMPWSPLAAAVKRKDDEIIQILRKAGAKVAPTDYFSLGW